MAERTSVTQVMQVGAETTPGTSVAANRRLPSFMCDMAPKLDVQEIPAAGYKFPAGHAPGKEWAEASLTGIPSYDELPYLLMSILSYAAPVQQAATTAYKWTHTVDTDAEDTIKTLTVEQGSAFRAQKLAYGLVNEFSLKFDRSKVEASASILGRAISDGITLTATPVVIDQVPLLGKELDVFADDTSAGLGGTRLARVLSGELAIKSRFGPLWTVDTTQASWAAAVEQRIDASLKLTVEADEAGMGLYTTAKAGGKKFIRVKSTSARLAGTAIPYSATFDICGQVADVGEFEDKDGVYAIEYTFGLTHDDGWNKALNVEVINKRTAI